MSVSRWAMCMLPAAATLVVGCGGSGGGGSAVVRDSAGIRIVESRGPAWGEGEAWRLSAEPIVSIGAMEADPEYQLFGVRRVARIRDGIIVVANSGSQEIRWYDAAGQHLLTAGMEGAGPGEFTSLDWLSPLPGDSIVAWDAALQRLSVFGPHGEFVRTFELAAEGVAGMERPAFVAPALDDGSLLVLGRVLNLQNMAEGPLIVPLVLYRYGLDGILLDSLGAFHGWESQVVIRRSAQVMQMAIRDRPFAHSTVLTAGRDRFFVGTPFAFEIAAHERDGSLVGMLRLARAVEPVTEEDIETYKRLALEDVEEENALRDRQRQLDEIEYPPTKPAFGAPILVDARGNLWVPEYRVDPDLEGRWLVFDRSLASLGTVTMPAGFRPYDIDDDTVLGVWLDDLDVEYVLGYELIKP